MKLISRQGIIGGVVAGSALAVLPVAVAPAAAEEDARTPHRIRRAKEIVRGFYESYNQRNLEASWERYLSMDVVIHVPGFDRESWLVFDNKLLAAFEDATITVFDQVGEPEKVATRWRLGGIHTGEFLGIPASGRYASFTATTVDRLHDGKIIEHWADAGPPGSPACMVRSRADFTAFLQQLAA